MIFGARSALRYASSLKLSKKALVPQCDYLRGGGDPDTPSKELIDFLKPPNAGGESGDMLLQPLFADTAAGAGSAASLPSGSAHAATGGAAGGSAPTFKFGYNRHAGA